MFQFVTLNKQTTVKLFQTDLWQASPNVAENKINSIGLTLHACIIFLLQVGICNLLAEYAWFCSWNLQFHILYTWHWMCFGSTFEGAFRVTKSTAWTTQFWSLDLAADMYYKKCLETVLMLVSLWKTDQNEKLEKFRLVVPVFHCYGHKRSCQVCDMYFDHL